MHGFPGTDTLVEAAGHVGHGAVLHGCHIGENAMVGMNSVIMDNAVVGEAAIVAAGAFVKANSRIEARHLAVGSPAKVVRALSDDEIAWKSEGTRTYQALAARSLASMVEVTPLNEPEPDRPRLNVSEHEPLFARRGESGG